MENQTWDPALYDQAHAYVADLARDLIDLLAPTPDDTVLDLGCGTGRMTEWLLASGARVIGVDSDPAMVAAARARCPTADLRQDDVRSLDADLRCTALLSNATLHWVPPADAPRMAESLARTVLPGGRLVVEFGGAGNIAHILAGLRAACERHGHAFAPDGGWYYPTLGAFASLLEAHGFSVRDARLFPRMTKLEGGLDGLRAWLEMFGAQPLAAVPAATRAELVAEVVDQCRPTLLRDGTWWADYVRLRVVALRA